METPPPARLAQDLRVNRLIWTAVAAGVVILTTVLTYLASTRAEPPASDLAVLFYVNAALSMGAIGAGFWMQRTLTEALPKAGTYEEAALLIRTRGIVSIAVMEASALFAAVATYVTGELINLAFVLPFFAFLALFFPTEARYTFLLGHRR